VSRAEIRRLAGKESYQGKYLDRRIANKLKLLDSCREREKQAKKEWLRAQLQILCEEDELNELIAVKRMQS